MVSGVVREWHEDEGWGVIDSVETPGGCWAHFTAIESPIIESSEGMTASEYKVVMTGDSVDLIWEQPGQDGFDFRAVTVGKQSS
jgi:CspA family cold shock protein